MWFCVIFIYCLDLFPLPPVAKFFWISGSYILIASLFSNVFHMFFPDGWGSKVKIAFVHRLWHYLRVKDWPLWHFHCQLLAWHTHYAQCLSSLLYFIQLFLEIERKRIISKKCNHLNYKSRKTSRAADKMFSQWENKLCCSVLKPVYKNQLLKLVGINQKIHLTANPEHLEGF